MILYLGSVLGHPLHQAINTFYLNRQAFVNALIDTENTVLSFIILPRI